MSSCHLLSRHSYRKRLLSAHEGSGPEGELQDSCDPREVHLGVFACGYQGHLCMWLWAPLFFLHKALAPWCSQRWACTAGTAGHPRAGIAAREGWQARLGAGVGQDIMANMSREGEKERGPRLQADVGGSPG